MGETARGALGQGPRRPADDAARALAGPAPAETPRGWSRTLGVEAFGLVPRLGVGGRAEFVAATAAGLFAAPADGGGAARPLLLAGLDHVAATPDGTLWLARGNRLERLAPGAARPEPKATLPASVRAMAAGDDGVAVLTGDAVAAYGAAGGRLWDAGVDPDARLVARLPGGGVAVAAVAEVGADTLVTRYAAGGARLGTVTLPGACRQLGPWPGHAGRLYAVTDAGLVEIGATAGEVRPVPGGAAVERVATDADALYGLTEDGIVLRFADDSPAAEEAKFPSPLDARAFAASGSRFAAVAVGSAGCRVVVVTGGVG